MSATQKRLLVTLADRAATGWHDTDQGIWEVRGEPRHFVHSKLMSWLGLDRAAIMAEDLDAVDRVEGWTKTRQ